MTAILIDVQKSHGTVPKNPNMMLPLSQHGSAQCHCVSFGDEGESESVRSSVRCLLG